MPDSSRTVHAVLSNNCSTPHWVRENLHSSRCVHQNISLVDLAGKGSDVTKTKLEIITKQLHSPARESPQKERKKKKHEETLRNMQKMSKVFVFARKIFDDFQGFPLLSYLLSTKSFTNSNIFLECVLPKENQQPILGVSPFFRGKVTISVGSGTKHTSTIDYQRKTNSPRSVNLSDNDYSFGIINHSTTTTAVACTYTHTLNEVQTQQTQLQGVYPKRAFFCVSPHNSYHKLGTLTYG